MKQYDKILFVSRSDTCRGPMAEAILQNKLLLEDVLVDSKGMVVLFPEPVNPKAQTVLEQNGLGMETHEAVQFSKDDFDARTLILTMEQAQKNKIMAEYEMSAKNVFTLAEYCQGTGDVFDPLGKDLSEYGKCFFELADMIEKLVTVLQEEEKKC